MPYATGAGTWAMADLSPAARTVLDDTTVAGMRTTLGTDLAENVNYTPQGTGAIVRTVQTKLRERGVSVTEFSSSDIGNGVVDATDAFLAAFATGEDVFVPPTENSYKLSALIPFATNGQTVYGSGSLSRIIQTGTEDDSIVFFGDVRANVRVRDLWLTPGTTAASQHYGFGVLFRDTAGIEVTGVQVTGHRRGGVGLINCAQAAIFRNYVHDSIINPAVDDHSEAGADFLVINGGEDIDIFQNWSIDGSGIGVGVISQLSAPGFTYKRIRIFDNLIRGQGQYGVLGYRSQMTDVFQGFDVCRNTIEDITGDIAHSADGKVYGAGVYIQGVEGSRVNDNSIRRTNTGTLVEQLAPAAIGIANCRDVDASRNLIEDCDWYGLMATDTNIQGVAGGVGTFLDNTIRRSGKDGVYLKDFPLAVVSGESSGSTGGAGLLAKDVGAAISELYDIRNFRALGNSGVGVRVEDGSATYTNVRAAGNQSGALVDGTGTHKFVGGQYSGNTNWGIVPNSANPNVETKNVTFGSNGFSDIYNDVPVKGLETNTYPSGTPFGGPYAEPRTLANSASPSVKNGRRFVTGGTTTITSLADLTIDQEVIIKAAHTVTVLGQALTSGKVLTAYNDGSGAVVKSVSP
jgi:hypothetical protein